MSTPYIFSQTELQKLLNDTIQMYADARDTDGHGSEYAQIITVSEVLESFDGMREIFRLDGAIERSDTPAELHMTCIQLDGISSTTLALCTRCLQLAANAAILVADLGSIRQKPHCARCHAPNRNRPSAGPTIWDEPPPSDGPGQENDTPDDGPRARQCDLPCHAAATHLVTTASGNTLHLCTRHAMAHRQSVPYVCSGCDADLFGGQRCTCAADAAAERAERLEVAA